MPFKRKIVTPQPPKRSTRKAFSGKRKARPDAAPAKAKAQPR